MNRITAREFFDIIKDNNLFEKAIEKMGEDSKSLNMKVESYNKLYSNDTEWTKTMETLYKLIAEELKKQGENKSLKITVEKKMPEDYNLYNEYFKIDASYWLEDETISTTLLDKLKLSRADNKIWKLIIALEHENKNQEWAYELKQLLEFDTTLKVLISYSKCDQAIQNPDKFQYDLKNLLNEFSKYHNLNEKDEFLFMFGSSIKRANRLEKIEYIAFNYKVERQGEDKKYILDDSFGENIIEIEF